MQLSFIGMPAVGKSHWSRKFVAAGFERIDVDGLIKDRISAHTGIHHTDAMMTNWLGFPDDAQYTENEQKFKRFENDAFKYVLEVLAEKEKRAPLIVDTGGSLVYALPHYWQLLKQMTNVVYLKLDKAMHPTLVTNYLRDTRAIIWNGHFAPQQGETRHESYARCYSNLIVEREAWYETYADCSIDYEQHRAETMTVAQLLKLI
jgi:shikimate kinase